MDFVAKSDSQSREVDDQTAQITRLEVKLQQANLEKDELIRSKKDREAKIQELTRKYAIEKEQHQQLRSVYQPKLKETIVYQRELQKDLQQIREDSELLPDMFRIESDQKKKIEAEFNRAVDQMRKAERDDAALRKKVENLTDEVERKKRLAMQAIAARGQFKQTLQDYQEQIAGFEAVMNKVNAERDEAK